MVLVTGATGFLGTELVMQLSAKGYEVRALYRSESKIPKELKSLKHISWIQADINDLNAMSDALEGVSQVYHCAAMVVIDEKAKKQQFAVNIGGTAQLVDLCLERPNIRLLHVSSIAALGENVDGKLIDENAKWEFNPKSSVYSISKFESELEVWRGIAEGLDAILVNPSLIIGGNELGSLSAQLQHLLRKGMPYYPKGGIGMVDVKDVASCMILLMNTRISAQRFILSAENYTYQRLFQEFAQAMRINVPHKAIGVLGLTMAYYAGKILHLFTGKANLLSKAMIRSTAQELYLDNSKVTSVLGFQFNSINNVILASCKNHS